MKRLETAHPHTQKGTERRLTFGEQLLQLPPHQRRALAGVALGLTGVIVTGAVVGVSNIVNSLHPPKAMEITDLKDIHIGKKNSPANTIYDAINQKLDSNGEISYDDILAVTPADVQPGDVVNVEVDKVSNRYEIKITDESDRLANTD